jgi:hypothetical protein
VSWTNDGIGVRRSPTAEDVGEIDAALWDGYATQLFDDGLVTDESDGCLISWDTLFGLLQLPEYADLSRLLGLPATTRATMSLRSKGALTDSDFSIAVSAWRDPSGAQFIPKYIGPVLSRSGAYELMQPEQWRLFRDVIAFSRRDAPDRHESNQRIAWGRIRSRAIAAGASLDDFLRRTVVLTPERLKIGVRKSDSVVDDHVIEIEPAVEGAPPSWLEQFDRNAEVRNRYDVATPEGVVQVVITQAVRTVLEEIKRLPGRRVAGSRAQAFIRNPYAVLGEDAHKVIDESQFEAARAAAGLRYERFVAVANRDHTGRPAEVGLLVEAATADGISSSETIWLDDAELSDFIRTADRALARNHQLIPWRGFDLEVQGDTRGHLDSLRKALDERRRPATLISYETVYDLSRYSSRVEGIGLEKSYHSPYIAKKKDEEGWFPENVLPLVVWTPPEGSESIAVPMDATALKELDIATAAAKAEGQPNVSVSWSDRPLSVPDAEQISRQFAEVFKEIERGEFRPERRAEPEPSQGKRKSLVVRPNIGTVDYEERRRHDALGAPVGEPALPRALRPDCELKAHQMDGIAWLQHLFANREAYEVRGAVLADDMGLGKTLQVLAFMAWALEQNPGLDPMLVVAPVTLLENWNEEIDKFFRRGALPVLTAYGDSLSALRVPRASIDERLRTEDGLVRFLKPGWVGDAKIVLTTYETLRDLEFSFAFERWSIMVCDEAQRIKNPAAMVTRSAKKQNVVFKIACTGTPVENTLADLWCLFDFVQPGLLGALNDFGLRYRKPIEAKTDEERARVEELRSRIAPQLLRRTKREVAPDLPKKLIDSACRELMLSPTQRSLYGSAIEQFRKARETSEDSPFKNHLGLLQYLRIVCTDPRRHGLDAFVPQPVSEYRVKAPKLEWLLSKLETIRDRDEKALVFCESRSIQRLLQHYIREVFRIRADIINGDTSASSANAESRQKRIKAFRDRSGFDVLILSPLAVGFGVNIQAANHVIHYTRHWNPAKEDQATDRAYRIGQTKDVHVYCPVVGAPDFVTFDVRLDQLLESKRALAQDMLNGSGDVGPGDFNIVDVVPEHARDQVDERVTIDLASRMDWRHFECLVQLLWARQGFECYDTPRSHDNGIDVVGTRASEGVLIQVKAGGSSLAPLGWDAVKEVVGGAALYESRHPSIRFQKVCVTNHAFNEQARVNADLNRVMLVERPQLVRLLQDHELTLGDIQRVASPAWTRET